MRDCWVKEADSFRPRLGELAMASAPTGSTETKTGGAAVPVALKFTRRRQLDHGPSGDWIARPSTAIPIRIKSGQPTGSPMDLRV